MTTTGNLITKKATKNNTFKSKTIKVIKLRDVNYDTAKKEVLGYYKSFDEVYISEVADNLELDIELVQV